MRGLMLLRAVALSIAATGLAVAAPDGATIATQGNGNGAPPCMACHGADGGGMDATGYPRLAGLPAAYLKRQLDSFADGSRANAIMKPTATALSEAERLAVATYYSGLPIPEAARAGSTPAKDNALGRHWALDGQWADQVPGCVRCHGPHGVGVGDHFPPLAGQPASYIANQLRDWQAGKRKNDPLGLMQHVVSVLDDADIEAVSQWFAAQPAVLDGDQP